MYEKLFRRDVLNLRLKVCLAFHKSKMAIIIPDRGYGLSKYLNKNSRMSKRSLKFL